MINKKGRNKPITWNAKTQAFSESSYAHFSLSYLEWKWIVLKDLEYLIEYALKSWAAYSF